MSTARLVAEIIGWLWLAGLFVASFSVIAFAMVSHCGDEDCEKDYRK